MINVFHWMPFSLKNLEFRKLAYDAKLHFYILTDDFKIVISHFFIFWQILMYVSQVDNIILFSTRGKANFKMP